MLDNPLVPAPGFIADAADSLQTAHEAAFSCYAYLCSADGNNLLDPTSLPHPPQGEETKKSCARLLTQLDRARGLPNATVVRAEDIELLIINIPWILELLENALIIDREVCKKRARTKAKDVLIVEGLDESRVRFRAAIEDMVVWRKIFRCLALSDNFPLACARSRLLRHAPMVTHLWSKLGYKLNHRIRRALDPVMMLAGNKAPFEAIGLSNLVQALRVLSEHGNEVVAAMIAHGLNKGSAENVDYQQMIESWPVLLQDLELLRATWNKQQLME